MRFLFPILLLTLQIQSQAFFQWFFPYFMHCFPWGFCPFFFSLRFVEVIKSVSSIFLYSMFITFLCSFFLCMLPVFYYFLFNVRIVFTSSLFYFLIPSSRFSILFSSFLVICSYFPLMSYSLLPCIVVSVFLFELVLLLAELSVVAFIIHLSLTFSLFLNDNYSTVLLSYLPSFFSFPVSILYYF